jgi:hypothetical protein
MRSNFPCFWRILRQFCHVGGSPTPDRCKGEYRFGRDQPIRIFRDRGFKLAQKQQRQLDRDAA